MADTPISKTQLRCLKENNWSLLDVAQSITKKSFHRNLVTGECAFAEHYVTEGRVDYGMVKEFLKDKNIVVDGRNWCYVELKEEI